MHLKKKDWISLCYVILSAAIYSLSMQIFVNSADLFPGGFAGLGYLIVRVLSRYAHINIPFGLVYVLLNLGPTLLVFRYVGKRFTILSMIQYGLVSLFTTVIPLYNLTNDILLITVFGGILSGFAISIALRHGASSGGMDFIAVYFANKFHRSTWNYAMAFTSGILIIAGFLFGWRTALYSIIYQFCSTQIVNLRHDRYKLSTLMIVTQFPNEVKENIFKTVRHGITVLNGKGGYKNQDESVLMMTTNVYQINDIVAAARKADPHVFINIFHTERIVGNYYQAPLD